MPRVKSKLADKDLGQLIKAGSGAGIAALRDTAIVAFLIACFVPVRTLRTLSTKTYSRNRDGAWLRFSGGFNTATYPCPQRLAACLDAYLQIAAVSAREDPYLFRTIAGASGALTQRALSQPDVFRIVQKRARAAGIEGRVSPRELRAAGLARFLRDGGDLVVAARLAGHRTTRSTIRYAQPGVVRPRNRIAYRLEDLDT